MIAEDREEVSEFRGLASTDETQALLARNRWQLWGRIWHNRVAQVRRRMPPLDVCAIHAALEPTCQALDASLATLDRVPEAAQVDAARQLLDEAAAPLEELRRPPEESEELSQTGGEGT